MNFSKKMEIELNKQINAEMSSAYLYLSMSANFEEMNLKGFANWMNIQAKEEMVHAMKLYDFVIERGGRVLLDSIGKPQSKWNSPLAAFEAAFKHEQLITSKISNLIDLATKEKDHASISILQWFIDEQVEEEASANDIVQKLKLMKGAPGGIFMLDKELGQRTFTQPTSGSG